MTASDFLNLDIAGAIQVKNESFDASYNGGASRVTGHFSAKGRSASGTVRDSGTFGTLTCDTGTVNWSATA